jgi:urea transport system substrate-binding protein
MEPALEWLINNKGEKLFLVGSDYIYPRSTNEQIKGHLQRRASIVGEEYLPLGSKDVHALVASIKARLPVGGVIINTLNGDTNVAFFNALKANRIDALSNYTVMSLSVAEEEVAAIGVEPTLGSMASWSYFQSLQTPASKRFTQDFQSAYGAHRVTNDPAEAAYTMVKLWAAAVERAGSTDTDSVRQALIGLQVQAPQGELKVFPNLHLSKRSLIGAVQPNGQFQIIHDGGLIEPKPWDGRQQGSESRRCDWRAAKAQEHR